MRGQAQFHAVVINSKFVFVVRKMERRKDKRELEAGGGEESHLLEPEATVEMDPRCVHKNHERGKSVKGKGREKIS